MMDKPTCGYCRDCKHWSKPLHGAGWCIMTDGTSLARACRPETKAFSVATVESPAMLKTWHNFGCVQFEPKESQ